VGKLEEFSWIKSVVCERVGVFSPRVQKVYKGDRYLGEVAGSLAHSLRTCWCVLSRVQKVHKRDKYLDEVNGS
jgi:hypothetical protein